MYFFRSFYQLYFKKKIYSTLSVILEFQYSIFLINEHLLSISSHNIIISYYLIIKDILVFLIYFL